MVLWWKDNRDRFINCLIVNDYPVLIYTTGRDKQDTLGIQFTQPSRDETRSNSPWGLDGLSQSLTRVRNFAIFIRIRLWLKPFNSLIMAFTKASNVLSRGAPKRVPISKICNIKVSTATRIWMEPGLMFKCRLKWYLIRNYLFSFAGRSRTYKGTIKPAGIVL